MKLNELLEQISGISSVGSSMSLAGGPTIPTIASPASKDGQLSGSTTDLQNPALQAAQLAQQKKEKDQRKKQIQDQIAALQKQLSSLSA